jgi:class 3 adenylate cyclase
MTAITATFLFTDLVDSTAISSALGRDAAEELRATHFGLLRREIAATGGVEVKNLGDGLMVTFSSAGRALACAVGMQQAIEHHNRRALQPLAIRIGLAAGEATEDDSDYFGEPVVEAARLCAAAAGGQILATDVVRSLVGRHSGQELRSVGELELKGLPDPVPTVEVAWEAADDADDDATGTVALPSRLVASAADGLFGFFGRDEALATLADARKRADSESRVAVVLVSGEAGIGKSTTVAHAARVAHGNGSVVLYGACDEDLAVPYQPWIDAITHLVQHRRELLDVIPVAQRTAIARLVPSLGVAADAGLGDAEAERLVLVDAIVGVLVAAAGAEPVVAVLDDLHWADRATLQVLRRLVTGGITAPITVVATYRNTDLAAGDPLTLLLADLRREHVVTWLALEGLGDDDMVALIAAAAGHELDADGYGLAHAVRRETSGNPYFTAELLRHLGESGAIYQNDDGRWVLRDELESLGLPNSVRDVVGRRVARLGDEATRVLTLASVIGRDFDVDLLAAVADVDEDALLDLLDTATGASLVAETELPTQYRFVHALVQHTLYSDLSALRRQRAHQRVAEALEQLHPSGMTAAELARHWLAATKPAHADKALRYAEQAADEALAALAPDDAIRWYTSALELLDRLPEPDLRARCRLLVGLGTAQVHAGVADRRDTLVGAARLALELDDTELLVCAVIAEASQATMQAGDDHRRALAEAALARIDPDDLALRAKVLLAVLQSTDAAAYGQRNELAAEAIRAAEGSGDAVATVVTVTGVAGTAAISNELLRRLCTTAMQLADETGSPLLRALARTYAGPPFLAVADRATERRVLAELDALAQETGLARLHFHWRTARSLSELLDGDIAAAEADAEAAMQAGLDAGIPEALGQYGGVLFEIRRQQGRLVEIAEFFIQAAIDNPSMEILRIAIAVLHLDLGALDAARDAFSVLVRSDFAEIPRDQTELLALMHCGELAARLRDSRAGDLVYPRLITHEHEIASPGAVVTGAVARVLGLLDHARGDFETGVAHFELALDLSRRLEAPFWIALTQIDYAVLLRDRGASGDAERADTMTAEALAAARRYGYTALERRAAAT